MSAELEEELENEDASNTQLEAKTNQPISHFFTQVLSVDETRVSLLLIAMLASLLFGGYMYFMNNEISANWVDVINCFVFSVAGINAVNAVSGQGGILSNFLGNNRTNSRTSSRDRDRDMR